MAARVYRYGLLPPTENADLVRVQMRKAHYYRNTLVEIERGRRAAMRATSSSHELVSDLEVAAKKAGDALDAALTAARKQRASTRSKSETEEQMSRVKEARSARKDARTALTQARAMVRNDAANEAAVARIKELAGELQRNARAHCGAYWGSYLLVEEAAYESSKMPLYDASEPNDPRFVRWTGEGRVGVQIQHGMTVDEALSSDDTRLRIARADQPQPKRNGRPRLAGKKDHRELWMRIASDGRDPVWAKWPMVLHRPLPASSMIKRASVSLKRVGPREEWSLHITVEIQDIAQTKLSDVVAIDIGWRVVPNGVRVAYLHDSNGVSREIVLPHEVIAYLTKPEELRGLRDDKFNAARAELVRWMAGAVSVPEWFLRATSTLSQWRSAGRLASLAQRWKTNRFSGDDAAYDAIDTWRYKDHHLWEWETSQRLKGLRRRREIYRTLAAELASQYGTVVFEKFDLRGVVKSPDSLSEDDATSDARGKSMYGAQHHRVLAKVSELRSEIACAVKSKNGSVEMVDAAHTTHICHVCGLVESWDASQSIHHGCTGCGTVWDQDENAARVLLARWHDRSSDAESGAIARIGKNNSEIKETKAERRARGMAAKAAKGVKTIAAREEYANIAE